MENKVKDFIIKEMTIATYMHQICGNFIRLKTEEEGWGVTSFSKYKTIKINNINAKIINKQYYNQRLRMVSNNEQGYEEVLWYGFDIRTIPDFYGKTIFFMPIIDNNVMKNKSKISSEIEEIYIKKEREKMWNLLVHLHARGGKNSSKKSIPLEIGHIIWQYCKDD